MATATALALSDAAEPDQQTLQTYIADLRADAPLARATLDYIDHDHDHGTHAATHAAQELIEAYWAALRQQQERQQRDQEQEQQEQQAELDDLDAAFRLYMTDIMRLGLPMKREQAFEAARAGRRNQLVEGNLLLVVSVANRWSRLPWRSKLDMIQEGNLGLLRAAEKFDPERGVSFAHYAYFWIERYVRNEAKRQDIPSGILPYTERITLEALRRQQTLLRQTLGRELTLTETVAHLHATQSRPPAHLRPTWPSVAEVQEWLAASELVYLSTVGGEGEDDARSSSSARLSLGDLLVDPRASLDEQLALNALEQLPPDSDRPRARRGARRTTRRAVPCARRELAQLLEVIWRERLLSEDDVRLIVLHFGVAHPARGWRPPKGWRVGCYHGFRLLSQLTSKSRMTLQRRYDRLVLRVGADEHPALRALATTLERQQSSLLR